MIGTLLSRRLATCFEGDALVLDYSAGDNRGWWADGVRMPKILEQLGQRKRLVIVWQDPHEAPSDSASSLAGDLTPLDWALALALRCMATPEVLEGLRIHIIDLTGHKYADAWAVRMRHQLLADLPWVTLHAPLVPLKNHEPARYRRAYGKILDAGGQELERSALLQTVDGKILLNDVGQGMSREGISENMHALASLARQWAASLVQGKDHHNVNNIVGPAILSRSLGHAVPAAGGLLVNAFVTKLNWSGVLSEAESSWKLDPVTAAQVKESGLQRLRILVVDDDLARGWDALVCSLFSKPRNESALQEDGFVRMDGTADPSGTDSAVIEVLGSSSPEPLLRVLRASPRTFVTRNYDISFSSAKEQAPELLILDLRLFSQASSASARKYIQTLLEMIGKLHLSAGEGLAWPPIPQAEVDLLQQWLDKDGVTPGLALEAMAITLLPRILALASPLTPIILFSSTGRADIKEKLKPYRNVLTGFSKPQVLQDFAMVKEAISEFLASIAAGLQMLARKERLAKCMRTAASVERERDSFRFNTQKQTSHIDFFFDESGDTTNESFGVGSIASVFTASDEAGKLQKFLKKCAEYGQGDLPVWAKAVTNSGTCLPKYSEIEGGELAVSKMANFLSSEIVRSGAQAVRERWTSLHVTRYDSAPPQIDEQPWKSPERHLDLVLDFSVQFNFFVLPLYLGLNNGTCGLYFDRRSIPPIRFNNYHKPSKWNQDAWERHKKMAEELEKRFGWEVKSDNPLYGREKSGNPTGPGKVFLNTYPVSAYYAFFRQAIMGWHKGWTIRLRYESVRGQQLSTRDFDPRRPDHRAKFHARRWLHDLADWVAGAKTEKQRGSLSDLFPVRLATTLDCGLEACMGAVRSASWGRRQDECIRALLENPRIYKIQDELKDDVERILVWACADTLTHATGEALHAHMSEPPVDSSETSRGHPVTNEPRPEAAERLGGLQLTIPTAANSDPWASVAAFKPRTGYELHMVSGRERIGGLDYWVLQNKKGIETAVAPVRQEDGMRDRRGQIGLWAVFSDHGPVNRQGKGLYSAFGLDYWFENHPVSEPTLPNASPAMQAHSQAVEHRSAGLPPQAREAEATRKSSEADPEQTVEAIMHSAQPHVIVFRSSDSSDRKSYCIERIGWPAMAPGDKALIRPRGGGQVKIEGRIMCDLLEVLPRE